MQLDVGQRFDRYQIVRQLGTGISGESYEAQDTLLQRTVTLKLIHPWSLLSDAIRRQFFREMQTMSLLNHPALASILNYSDMGRQLYLAHKYAPLGSLLGTEGRTWFSPPLPLEDALRYTVQLAQPLGYLHYNGFFHGALTLANVLIQYDPSHPDTSTPQFLLADASLAHFVRRYGHPIMTILPITAAPEQFYGRASAASDQYALASLLYYWLAARPPFLGAPEEIKRQKLQTTAPLLSTLNSLVTSELAFVIQRALSPSVEDRFHSLQNFTDALQETYRSPIPEETNPALPLLHPRKKQECNEQAMDLESAGSSTEPSSEPTPTPDPVQPVPPVPVEPEPTPVPPDPAPAPVPVTPEPEPTPVPPEPTPVTPIPVPVEPEPTPVPPDPAPAPVPVTPEPTPITPAPELKAWITFSSHSHSQPLSDNSQPIEDTDKFPQLSFDALEDTDEFPQLSFDSLDVVTEALQQASSNVSQHPIDRETGAATADSCTDNATSSSAPDYPNLVITSPYTDAPYEVIIDHEEMTIGRAGSSDILLDYDPFTSRHHALLQKRDDHYVISDRRSAYGTTVNGQTLINEQFWPLQEGDEINIGQYKLIFRASSAQKTHHQAPQQAQI